MPECLICNTQLQVKGCKYSIEQLFELLKPTQFSQDLIKVHRDQSNYTQLYQCPNCKLEIFLPPIIGSPQFYIEMYSTSNKDLSLYVDDRWEFYKAQQDLIGTQSVIEIGYGKGEFLKKIREIVPHIICIEYNEYAITIARENGFIVYTPNDYINEKFDAIVAFHVLEHVSNPLDFIKSLSAKIKNNGKIYISVPNQDGPMKFIEPCIHNMPPHHATRWHAKTFKILSDQLHLSVEKIEFEPLAITDHYYYTYYWINSKITGNSYIHKLFRLFLNKTTSGIFEILKLLHVRHFKWLTGQSIYVILRKD